MTENIKRRIAVSTLFALSGFCFSSWVSRIPDISRHLHLDAGRLGEILLAGPVGSLISLPLAGWLIQKWGSRYSALLSAALYAGLLVLLSYADSFLFLLVTMGFFSIAGNILNVASNTQAIGVQSTYPQPIIGSFHGLWSLAGFLGGALGAALISLHQSPARHFMLTGCLILLTLFWTHNYTLRHDIGSEKKASIAVRQLDTYLLRVGLIAFCGMLSEGAVFDWVGIYFQQVIRPSPALVTSGYIVCIGAVTVGRFLSDYFTHRYGSTRILQASSVFIAVGLLLAVCLPYLLPAILGFTITGLGIASIVPLSNSAASRSRNVPASVVLALVSSIGFLGFLSGPPIIGFLAQSFGLRAAMIAVALVALGVGLLASLTPTESTDVHSVM